MEGLQSNKRSGAEKEKDWCSAWDQVCWLPGQLHRGNAEVTKEVCGWTSQQSKPGERFDTSAVVEHEVITGHRMNWDETRIIDRQVKWPSCKVKEALHIEAAKLALNRDRGVELSASCYSWYIKRADYLELVVNRCLCFWLLDCFGPEEDSHGAVETSFCKIL